MKNRAVVMMLGFVFLWTLVEGAGVIALRAVGVWETVWIRYSVHLLIVLAVWWRPGERAPWQSTDPRRQLLRSTTMLVMPGSFALAIRQGFSADSVMAIFWSAPLIVLAFAAMFGGERPSRLAWMAAALGWLSGWLYHGLPAISLGVIPFALAMAVSFAMYVVMTRGLRNEAVRANMFFTAVVPWLALTPLMIRGWVTPSAVEVLALVFIGSAGWVALLALDKAAKAAPVSHTAPLLSLQIASTAAFMQLIWPSTSFPRLAVSTAVVMAACVLAWRAIPRPAMAHGK
jgi:drug/metabolite transporter (DMT)-like permease